MYKITKELESIIILDNILISLKTIDPNSPVTDYALICIKSSLSVQDENVIRCITVKFLRFGKELREFNVGLFWPSYEARK